MYDWTSWVDETDQYENRYTETANPDGTITHKKVTGEVYVQGTPQSAANFNKIESGIVDGIIGAAQMLIGMRQNKWRTDLIDKAVVPEYGMALFGDDEEFPFYSGVSVALQHKRDNIFYTVDIIQVNPHGGPSGEIKIYDRQVNGFKIAYTGSAKSIDLVYVVYGGIAL